VGISTAEQPDAAIDRRKLARRAGQLVAGAVVAIVLIDRVPGLSSLRSRFAGADAGWIGVSILLEIISVVGFVVALHAAFARRIPWRASASIGATVQGVNVLVPAGGTGGLAVVGVILTRAGISAEFTASRMIALFLITSIATNVLLIVVGGVGVGTGLLPGHVSWEASLLPALGASLLIVAIAYLPRRLRAAGPPRGRAHALLRRAAGHLSEGINLGGRLLRDRDPLLALGAVSFVVADLLALGAAFAAIESGGLPLGPMLLAYTLGQIGSVISLPGTTEGGLVGTFVLFGVPLTVAAAAILLYRAVQASVPLVL